MSPTAAAPHVELTLLDGRLAPTADTVIPVTDQGFIRGDGVFEVIRVYEGAPFALDEHLDRMERSAHNLRLGYEVPRARLEEEAAQLLEARGGRAFDGALRIILTIAGRRLLMTEPMPAMPASVRLGFVTYAPTRVLDGIKSLSYAANMLCTRLARERGFDEALLVTPHGRVLEAPTSSFFWAGEDGVLSTPPLDDHILASITRAHIMRLVDVEERVTTWEDVRGAREAFLASTLRDVQPVAAIEEHELTAPGELSRAAEEAMRTHVASAI